MRPSSKILFLHIFILGLHFITYIQSKRMVKLGRLITKFHYIEGCEENHPDYKYTNMTVIVVKSTFLMNGYITFKRTVDPNKVVVKFRRCDDSAQVDCEVYPTWRFGKEVCQLVEMKDAVWGTLFSALVPNIHCPLKKGVYELRNGTFDTSIVDRLFGEIVVNKFWRVQFEAFDPIRAFLCFKLGVSWLRAKS